MAGPEGDVVRLVRMLCNEDVWRLAALMVGTHGARAKVTALRRARRGIDRCDLQEFGLWFRVADAVTDFLKTKPGAGEHVH